MSQAKSAAAYIEKARRAISGARHLLVVGDTEGACSRAYYAMFDAAHAALLAVDTDGPKTTTKTHQGLIAAFGVRLVQPGHMDAQFGRTINKVQRLRQIADYLGDPPSLEDATWAVDQAGAFIEAVRMIIVPTL